MPLGLNEEQIRRLRQTETQLLSELIAACEKLNLQYFVVEGTLLGAVRHHGFIPWDDDIDVGMLRKDYDIFLAQAPAILPDDCFLQTRESDKNYPHCFAKLRRKNTAFLETSCKNIAMEHGIYIDIFPFDAYPDGFLQGIRYDWLKLLVKYRVREVFYLPEENRFSLSAVAKKILQSIARIRFRTVEDALACQQKQMVRFHDTKRVMNNGSPWNNRERFDASWLDATTDLDFEGLRVKAPAKYHEYLTHVYGDYMTLPPEDERIPHHYISYLSFENSYPPDSEETP